MQIHILSTKLLSVNDQAEAKTREVLGFGKLLDINFSFPSHRLHNYSFPSAPNYLTDPPLHLTLTAGDSFFLKKCCCRLIFIL